MSKSKIIVCAHKKDFVMDNELYMPLQVGKAISKVDLGFQGDDTGDNISAKNPNYCELTGLYWAWKNLKDVDYIGLAHYRRYFDFMNSVGRRVNIYTTTIDDLKKKTRAMQDGEELLGGADIVLPKPWYMSTSVEYQYRLAHITEEYYILVRCILMLYPDYAKDIETFWVKDNRWIGFNMFFSHYSIFDDYCRWLFSILEEVSVRVHICDYAFQRRIFGFMGEIMLPLYCFHNKLKIRNCSVMMVGDKMETPSNVRKWLQDLKSNAVFKLNQPLGGKVNIVGTKNFDADGITF